MEKLEYLNQLFSWAAGNENAITLPPEEEKAFLNALILEHAADRSKSAQEEVKLFKKRLKVVESKISKTKKPSPKPPPAPTNPPKKKHSPLEYENKRLKSEIERLKKEQEDLKRKYEREIIEVQETFKRRMQKANKACADKIRKLTLELKATQENLQDALAEKEKLAKRLENYAKENT